MDELLVSTAPASQSSASVDRSGDWVNIFPQLDSSPDGPDLSDMLFGSFM